MGNRSIVLIVDDMEINRLILGEYLKGEYTIMEAEDGKEALDIIRKYKEEIKVVLLDRLMPHMDGFQVLKILKEERVLDTVPVILITGDYSTEEGESGYTLGISELITKPFEPFIVKKRIKNIIELYEYKKEICRKDSRT